MQTNNNPQQLELPLEGGLMLTYTTAEGIKRFISKKMFGEAYKDMWQDAEQNKREWS